MMRVLLGILCSFFIIKSGFSQYIEGTYDRQNHAFILKEKDYYKSVFTVNNPGVSGYFVIYGGDSGSGVIDSTGKIVVAPEGNCKFIKLQKTKDGVYVIANHKTHWRLKSTTGVTILQSESGRILFLSENETGAYFFMETATVNTNSGSAIKGNIYGVKNNKGFVVAGNQVFLAETYLSYDDKRRADLYFNHSLLITPLPDGFHQVLNYQLDTLFKDLKISYVLNTDSLMFITTDFNRYKLVNATNPYQSRVTFDSYKIDPAGDFMIINKNGFSGAILHHSYFENHTLYVEVSVLPPLFDSADITYHRTNGIKFYKADTVFYYKPNTKKGGYLNYRSDFNEAYTIDKKERYQAIGYNGVFVEGKRNYASQSVFVPNGFWLGTNYQSQNFVNKFTKDTFDVSSFNIDAGIGWYDFYEDEGTFFGSWQLYGGGIGLEYRFPSRGRTTIEGLSGKKYGNILLNARAEAAIGVSILGLPLGVHGQLGYTTDFNYSFLRPGFGLSFGRLQAGAEYLFCFGGKVTPIAGVYLKANIVDGE